LHYEKHVEKMFKGRVIDYRSEVICKLNDIIRWKDEDLRRIKQDVITLNDKKTLDENIE